MLLEGDVYGNDIVKIEVMQIYHRDGEKQIKASYLWRGTRDICIERRTYTELTDFIKWARLTLIHRNKNEWD